MLHKDLLILLSEARDMLRVMPDRPTTVQQAADASGMSLYHFIRLFKAVFGETPNQYQIRLRLETAKLLLAESDLSITEICMEIGYSSLGSFSDLFARRVGTSPSSYREHWHAAHRAAHTQARHSKPDCFLLMCGPLDEE